MKREFHVRFCEKPRESWFAVLSAYSTSCGASANGKPSFAEKKIKCPKCEEIVQFEIIDSPAPQAVAGSRVCPTCSTEIQEGTNACPKCREMQKAARVRRDKEAGENDFFKHEKKALDKGVMGSLFLIVVAVVWFVAGLAGGIIFYYPPVLLVIGIVGVVKGLATGNITGNKGRRSRRRR